MERDGDSIKQDSHDSPKQDSTEQPLEEALWYDYTEGEQFPTVLILHLPKVQGHPVGRHHGQRHEKRPL